MENQTQDYFTRHAHHYEGTPGEESISTPIRKTLLRGLGGKVTFGEESKLLDLACGAGKLLELAQDEFSLRSNQLFGIDLTPAMITVAKNKPKLNGAQLAVGNVESLPYSDNMFDAVTTTFSFHHFASEKSLSEIKRVLKTGGILAIADLCPPVWMPAKIFDSLLVKVTGCNVGGYRNQRELSKFLAHNDFQIITQNRVKGVVKGATLLTLAKAP